MTQEHQCNFHSSLQCFRKMNLGQTGIRTDCHQSIISLHLVRRRPQKGCPTVGAMHHLHFRAGLERLAGGLGTSFQAGQYSSAYPGIGAPRDPPGTGYAQNSRSAQTMRQQGLTSRIQSVSGPFPLNITALSYPAICGYSRAHEVNVEKDICTVYSGQDSSEDCSLHSNCTWNKDAYLYCPDCHKPYRY
jgi:hypothetical protein